jgi:hypothetical protein
MLAGSLDPGGRETLSPKGIRVAWKRFLRLGIAMKIPTFTVRSMEIEFLDRVPHLGCMP